MKVFVLFVVVAFVLYLIAKYSNKNTTEATKAEIKIGAISKKEN